MADPDLPAPTPAPPTIALLPSLSSGHCLDPLLLLNSNEWLVPLSRDVDALLDAFVAAWTSPSAAQAELSPFEVFKQLWIELGWANLHLVAVPDGPNRLPFARSIARAFTDKLAPTEAPLRQVAALFATYAIWVTQPRTATRLYVPVDGPTLEYIASLPEQVDPALASAVGSSSTAASPALDVAYVVHSLFTQIAFFCVPSETVIPSSELPLVRIANSREGGRDKAAKLALAIEREMLRTADGLEADHGNLDDDTSTVRPWGVDVQQAGTRYAELKRGELAALLEGEDGDEAKVVGRRLVAEAEHQTRHAMNGGKVGIDPSVGARDLLGLVSDQTGSVSEAFRQLNRGG